MYYLYVVVVVAATVQLSLVGWMAFGVLVSFVLCREAMQSLLTNTVISHTIQHRFKGKHYYKIHTTTSKHCYFETDTHIGHAELVIGL